MERKEETLDITNGELMKKDYKPRDLFDKMALKKGDKEIVALRNELRKEMSEKFWREVWFNSFLREARNVKAN